MERSNSSSNNKRRSNSRRRRRLVALRALLAASIALAAGRGLILQTASLFSFFMAPPHEQEKMPPRQQAVRIRGLRSGWGYTLPADNNRTAIAARQVQSYRRGTGLVVSVHITHHGGTALCHAIGRATGGTTGKGAPSFACMNVRTRDKAFRDSRYPRHRPWRRDETASNIALARRYFHFVSWEFGLSRKKFRLDETDWEDPNLVSVVVMRDPSTLHDFGLVLYDPFTNRSRNMRFSPFDVRAIRIS